MLKREVARLTAALERREGTSEADVDKLKTANRVLENHVERLRSSLAAARSDAAEQAALQQGLSREGSRSRLASVSEEGLAELEAEISSLRNQNKVRLKYMWAAAFLSRLGSLLPLQQGNCPGDCTFSS